ncbi:MAG: HAMP domain-containing histidine kinase [Bacteroidales bacterium]|nr:HAMP domain-containing histidine kinase [Bacteroidales bacterium]
MKIASRYLYMIKIAAILLLSMTTVWLFLHALYFSSLLVLICILALAISLYYDRRMLISRMERMISGIRNADYSFHYPQNSADQELNRLSKEMDQALQLFRDRAQHAYMEEAESEAWQKLISVLTHEIMNSIAPIISLSETLGKEEAPALQSEEECLNMRRAMQTIHRRSAGLLTFVENYRKLTRIPQPVMQPIRAAGLLRSLQQLVEADHICFTFSCYPEQLVLRADRNMVDQMLINLLKNAGEATEERSDPVIQIVAQQVGSEVQITVSDNGTGISPEAIDKVFIPFYSTKTKGSGIGLSLCRQMMIHHKGRITVSSDDQGTRFTLFFPV